MGNLSDNVQDKFLQTALREAQNIGLQEILGTALLDKIKTLVSGGTISDSENAAYKEICDEAQLYLFYATMENLLYITNFKVSNGGIQQTKDEHLDVLDIDDTGKLKSFYTNKKDFYCSSLQRKLLRLYNQGSIPELTDNDAYNIKSTLSTSSSTGLWLGGARGKGVCRHRKCGYDKP